MNHNCCDKMLWPFFFFFFTFFLLFWIATILVSTWKSKECKVALVVWPPSPALKDFLSSWCPWHWPRECLCSSNNTVKCCCLLGRKGLSLTRQTSAWQQLLCPFPHFFTAIYLFKAHIRVSPLSTSLISKCFNLTLWLNCLRCLIQFQIFSVKLQNFHFQDRSVYVSLPDIICFFKKKKNLTFSIWMENL